MHPGKLFAVAVSGLYLASAIASCASRDWRTATIAACFSLSNALIFWR